MFGRMGARGGFGGLGALGGAGLPFLAPVQLSAVAPAADAQCWFHEPRAVASGGKLWFGTNGSNDGTTATARATIFEVDERTNAVIKRDLITGTGWSDDHAYPVVMTRPDGRLVVFYCTHRLTAPIRYRISVSPGTMANGWSQEYDIGVDATNPTYPSPVMLSGEGNKVYLFFRNGVAVTLSYLTSTDLATVAPATVDGGALGATPTWSAETQLTASAGTQGIYHKVHSNSVDRIDVLMTDAIADAAGQKNDVRHAYYNAGNWYTSSGTSLGSASSLIAFSSFTAVATSGAPDNFGDVWVWHVQRRTSGTIEALFARFISVSDHHYYYARWDGSSWSKSEIDAGHGSGTPDTRSSQITSGGGAAEGYYSPGLYLDTNDEGVIYCAIGNSSYSLLYRYVTLNSGASWARARVSGMIAQNVRSFVPKGRTTKYAVLWMQGGYQFYDFSPGGYTTHINAASRNYSVGTAAPANTSVPTISGTAQSGNAITAGNGVWTGDLPMTFAYQWARDGVDLSGSTASTYTVVSADDGHTLTVRVTAMNDIGTASATSAGASATTVNLYIHSEHVDSVTLSGVSATANVAATILSGATTMARIAEQTSTVPHTANSANIAFANATAYTFSMEVKFETRQFVQLFYGSAAFGTNAYANFDIQNGTVQTVGSAASAAIVSLGSGHYRIIITATSTAGAAATAVIAGATAGNSARAVSYAGNASNTWLAGCAQVETGSTANPYAITA